MSGRLTDPWVGALRKEPVSPPSIKETRIPSGVVVAGRLQVKEELGRGGTAVVYRAFDQTSGADVALKIATKKAMGSNAEARYVNEDRLGRSLEGNDNVVRALGVGKLDSPAGFEGRMFLMAELVLGAPLDEVMLSHPKGLPERRAVAVALGVARALVGLHERGIVHRDVKPGNVLLTETEGGESSKLADLGFAFATGDGWEFRSPDLTSAGQAPGTMLYMPLEQAVHERPRAANDIYAFGVTLYELFAGNPPHSGVPDSELMRRKMDPDDSGYPIASMCPELSPHLATLVMRCMEHEPGLRPSAAEVVTALSGSEPVGSALVVAGSRLPSVKTDPVCKPVVRIVPMVRIVSPVPIAHSGRSRRIGVTVAIFATLLACVLGASLLWEGQGEVASIEPAPLPEVGDSGKVPIEVPAPKLTPETTPEITPKITPKITPGSAVEPGPDVTPGSAVKVAPEAAPKSAVRRPKRKKARHEKPPTAVLDHETEACRARVARANKASAAGRWSEVLQMTATAKCWGPGAGRTKIRTHALLDAGRYADCARLGRESRDSDVKRWTNICVRRKEQGSGL